MKAQDILRLKRKNNNYTQKKISELLGVSSQYISNLETGKKNISPKILLKFHTIASFTDEELKILKLKEKISPPKINDRELELIGTYEFIRRNHNKYAMASKINNSLIELNKALELNIHEIELLLSEYNDEIFRLVKNPIKATIKRIEEKKIRLKNIILDNYNEIIETKEKKEPLMGILDKYTGTVNFNEYSSEEKRITILTWVAENIKYRLKDYNITGRPTGYSRRLWGKGRGNDPTKKTFMPDKTSEQLNLQIDALEDEDLGEIADGIIEASLIVMEDLMSAGRSAKTGKVRDKYLKATMDTNFLISTLQLAIILYSKELLAKGHDLKHLYLSTKIRAVDSRKKELSLIWSNYENDKISLEEAIQSTEILLIQYETMTLNPNELDKVTDEKRLLKLVNVENFDNYIKSIVEEVSSRITGKIELILD